MTANGHPANHEDNNMSIPMRGITFDPCCSRCGVEVGCERCVGGCRRYMGCRGFRGSRVYGVMTNGYPANQDDNNMSMSMRGLAKIS